MYKRHLSTILALCFLGAIALAACFLHTQPAPPLYVVPCLVGASRYYSTINVAFSPDGRQMATVTVEPNAATSYRLEADGTHRSFAGKLVDPFVAKLALRRGYRFAERVALAQAPNIAEAQFSADGRYIAASVARSGDSLFGRGGQVVVWNAVTGRRIGMVPYTSPSASGVFDLSRNGSALAVYGANATIYSIPKLRRLRIFKTGTRAVSGSMDTLGDKICLLSRSDGSARALVSVFDMRTGRVDASIEVPQADRAEILPDGTHVLISGRYHGPSASPATMRLWDVHSGNASILTDAAAGDWYQIASSGASIAFSSERFARKNGHLTGLGHVAVYDVHSGNPVWRGTINGIAQYAKLSPDGKLLAFTAYEKNAAPRIEIVDVGTRKIVRNVPFRAGTDAEFAPDSSQIAVPFEGGVEFYGPFKP